jgi:hypothetical protein
LDQFEELSEELGSQEAAILSLMRHLKIDVESIKALLPDKLASFCNTKYEKIAAFST